MADPNSLTGQYLSGKKQIPLPAERRTGSGKALRVIGAAENNLRGMRMWTFPLGNFPPWSPASAAPASPLWSTRCSSSAWGQSSCA